MQNEDCCLLISVELIVTCIIFLLACSDSSFILLYIYNKPLSPIISCLKQTEVDLQVPLPICQSFHIYRRSATMKQYPPIATNSGGLQSSFRAVFKSATCVLFLLFSAENQTLHFWTVTSMFFFLFIPLVLRQLTLHLWIELFLFIFLCQHNFLLQFTRPLPLLWNYLRFFLLQLTVFPWWTLTELFVKN